MSQDAAPACRLEKPVWCATSAINVEIADLIAHSYVDPTALLEREFEHNDLLYYVRDDEGRLVAFFMVARERLTIDGRSIPAVYLGLSATSRDTKGSGRVRRLYASFIAEARGWQRALDRPLLLWGTTATPSAYHAADLLFDCLEPGRDGACSREGAAAANALRGRYGLGPAHEHPFVLPAVAAGTRYSPDEESRIDSICQQREFDLFARLGVNQRRGDRLLLVCRVPERVTAEVVR
jgi:hypothetical protein